MYYSQQPVKVLYQFVKSFDPGNGTGVTTSQGTFYGSEAMNSRSGVSNKGFRQAIRHRLSASTGYASERYTVEQRPGRASFWYRYDPFQSGHANLIKNEFVGDIVNFYSWPVSSITDLQSCDDEAKTGFLRKLYKAQTTFSGGIFLGELRQTIDSIRHPLHALRSGFTDYLDTVAFRKRKRGRRSIAALNRMVANTYLEFNFGWRPLVSDINDAVKAAANELTYRSPTEHLFYKASRRNVIDAPNVFFTQTDNGYRGLQYGIRNESILKVWYVGGMYAHMQGTLGTAGNFGFQLRSFVPTVWELIPYSFVADYFTNMGDSLEAMCANQADVYYCTRSLHEEASTSLYMPTAVNNLAGDPAYIIERDMFDVGYLKLLHSIYQRNVVMPGSLAPSFRFKVPGLFSKQSLNVAALLAKAKSVSHFLTS